VPGLVQRSGIQSSGLHSNGPAVLALADGRVFRGLGFGAKATVVGEVVFNTSMTGYQEILSDPSYRNQMVVLTASEIGNVGTNDDDVESGDWGATALVCRNLSPVVSNWRSTADLPSWMAARGIPGIYDIDTRALTKHLRVHGAVMGALSTEHADVDALLELARRAPSMEGSDLASEVSTRARYEWSEGSWGTASEAPARYHVVAWDFGIKRNILRCLRDAGAKTTVLPVSATADEILALKPDGVLLSNGPGDPAAVTHVVKELRKLLEAAPKLPVFGICLGHQLLGLALGGSTSKLKFGHHGGNHPVRDEATKAVQITSQNHGFAVDLASLGGDAILTRVNLFDGSCEGLRMAGRPVAGVQYHPEAAPGPNDARGFFAEFATAMAQAR
jgi:carbamoyl-phosphate synthase small subunit